MSGHYDPDKEISGVKYNKWKKLIPLSQENIDKQAEHALWQTKLYNEPLHDLNESVQRNEPEQMVIK